VAMLGRSLLVSPVQIILRIAVLMGDTSHHNVFLMLNIENQIRESTDVNSTGMFADFPPQLRPGFNVPYGFKKALVKATSLAVHLIVVIINCILQLFIRWRQ
jgi:hypothetical protein